MPTKTDPTGYSERLREWQCGVVGWLGLNSSEVYRLEVTRERHMRAVGWKAIARQPDPRVGRAGPRGLQSDGERVTHTGSVWLTPPEWADLIGDAGEEPELLTRQQESMLRGLAAEAADR